MKTLPALQLDASAARMGETLSGVVLLQSPDSGPLMECLTVRLKGTLHYTNADNRSVTQEVPGGQELVLRGPFGKVPQVPFRLTLPREVPPSHLGQTFRVAWEVVACLEGKAEGLRWEWRQPLQLECALTRKQPVLVEPLPPSSVSGLGSAAVAALNGMILAGLALGTLGFVALVAFTLLRLYTPGMAELRAGVLAVGVASVGVGVLAGIRRHRKNPIKASGLAPRAERFPLGGRAKLRVHVETNRPLTLRSATLRLVSYEQLMVVQTHEAPAEFPRRLEPGVHRINVDVTIPRHFGPTYEGKLRTWCALEARFMEDTSLGVSTPLVLAPEVFEEDTPAPAPAR